MPNSVTSLNWTPIFELSVLRCSSKYGYHKDIRFEETRLHAQNMIIILGSTINSIEVI